MSVLTPGENTTCMVSEESSIRFNRGIELATELYSFSSGIMIGTVGIDETPDVNIIEHMLTNEESYYGEDDPNIVKARINDAERISSGIYPFEIIIIPKEKGLRIVKTMEAFKRILSKYKLILVGETYVGKPIFDDNGDKYVFQFSVKVK